MSTKSVSAPKAHLKTCIFTTAVNLFVSHCLPLARACCDDFNVQQNLMEYVSYCLCVCVERRVSEGEDGQRKLSAEYPGAEGESRKLQVQGVASLA